MGDLPHVAVGTEQVEAEPDEAVDARIVRVRAVQRIMRHPEADARHADAHEHREEEHAARGEPAAEDQGVAPKRETQRNDRSRDHHAVRLVG